MLSAGPTGTLSRAISFWARTNNNALSQAIFSYGSIGPGAYFQLNFNQMSGCNGPGLDASNQAYWWNAPCVYNNDWHHIVASYDSNVGQTIQDISFFVDGIQMPAGWPNFCFAQGLGQAINTGNASPITISGPGSRWFKGDIDDIYLYDRALTPIEVQQLFAICTLQMTGNTSVCPGSVNTYTALPVPGAITYTWTLPNGWIGNSLTNTISVTASGISGIISVAASNSCGQVLTQTLAVTSQNGLSITGNTLICPFSTNNYSTTPLPNVSSYTWNLPGGWTGNSLTNTISITSGTTSGTVSVSATGSCGVVTQTLSISISPPQSFGSISGNTLVCPGSANIYSVALNPSVTIQNWQLPSGWNGNSGTNIINLIAGANSGLISINGIDNCGNPVSQTLSVTILSPQPMPGVVGNVTVCPNQVYTYSVPAFPGAQGYSWNFPGGWNQLTGGNSVNVMTSGASGIINVQILGVCTFPITHTLGVTVILPPTNLNISGNTIVCPNSTNSYTATSIPGATYVWNLPGGWTGTSTTNTINITVDSNPGSISVIATDACGNTINQSITIAIYTPQTSLTISGSLTICPNSTNTYTASQVTGAASYTWALPGGWTGNSTTNTISISSNTAAGTITVAATDNCGVILTQTATIQIYNPSPPIMQGYSVVCQGVTSYYMSNYPGVWTTPPGWTVYPAWSGLTGISATPNANSGVVSATLTDACSAVYVLTMAVTVASLQQSLNISGNLTVCPGSINNYTFSGVSGVSSYWWSVSNGWTGSLSGDILTTTANSNSTTISVIAYGACGTYSQTLVITVPSQTNLAISGPTLICPNTTNTYIATPVIGASSYSWTLPGGWTGTSTTNSISVTSNTSTGTLSVSVIDFCGNLITQSLMITVPQSTANLYTTYGVWCPGLPYNFVMQNSINITGANSYTWTLPPGWQPSYTVTPSLGFGTLSGTNSGTATVATTNFCGMVVTATAQVDIVEPNGSPIQGSTLVCPGSTNVYSIPQAGSSTNISWTIPNGWSIQGTGWWVNITNNGTPGIITFTALSYCGWTYTQTLAVGINTAQSTLTLTGNTNVCPNSVNSYTASGVSSPMGSYGWFLPNGWTGPSWTMANVITTTISSSGTLSVSVPNFCYNSITQTLAVTVYTPQSNLSINGSTVICPGNTFTYTAGSVNCASSYTWSLPNGWTGTSNSGTIVTTVNNNPGTITVTAVDCCGNLITQTLTVVMYTPQGSLSISGPTLACLQNGTYTYNASPVSGALSYTWTLPSGWSGTSSTYTIGANPMFNTGGTISVTAINACGNVVTQTLAVSVHTAQYTSSIAGPTLVCPGSVNSYTYNFTTGTPNYTYTQYFPGMYTGWSAITASTIVYVPAPTNQTVYVILVEGQDNCGIQQNVGINVLVALTQTNLAISGNTTVCPGSFNTYTAGTVTGASSYNWYAPSGWAGSVSSSNVMTFTAGLSPGTITVTALNYCGVLITQTLAVNVIPTQTGLTISGNTMLCSNTPNTYVASLVNGASSYNWILPAGWLSNPASTSNVINVISGAVPATLTVTATNGCGIIVTQTLIINPVPPIGLSVSQNSLNFCSNNPTSATITASSTLTGVPVVIVWTPGPIISATAVINPTTTTIYTVTALVPGACVTALAQVTVNVNTNCCSQSTVGMATLPSNASGNFIGGPFLINQNVTLSGATLFMGEFIAMPNVQITVPNGVQLSMRMSHMYACGLNMWQGINVQNGGNINMYQTTPPNFIEDAIAAVSITNIATQPAITPIIADGTLFNKNHTSINISNAPSLASVPVNIKNCVFTSRTIPFTSSSWAGTGTVTAEMRNAATGATLGLNSPYTLLNYSMSNLKAPYSSQIANTGINILNVGNGLGAATNNGVDIGFAFPVTEGEFNLFDNLGNGFEIINANVSTMNNVFQNIQRFTTPAGISGGYGIKDSVTGTSMMNPRLRLSPATNGNQNTSLGNRFWNCYIGIRATNVYNLDVSYALFRSSQALPSSPLSSLFLPGNTGIYLRTNRLDYSIQLSEFNNLTNGILIDFVTGAYNMGSASNGVYASNLLISQNYFGAQVNSTVSVGSTFLSDAIKLAGPNSGNWTFFAQGIIQSNKIDRAYRGISVSGMNGYGTIIRKNRIALADETILTTPALRQYALQGLVTLNGLYLISNTLTAATQNNSLVTLIHFQQNSGAVIQCNILNTGYKAMEFEGANALAWRGNTMQNHNFGIYFSASGSFGQQGFNSVNDNQWLGFWPATSFHTYFDNSIPMASQLRVRNALSTFIPTNNGPLPNGGYILNSPNLTAVTNNTPYNCPNPTVPPMPNQRSENEEMITNVAEVTQNPNWRINIFPNPTSGQVTISSEEENENLKIRILDVSGKESHSFNMISNGSNTIDVSSLINGIYLIEIENSRSEKIYKKLILSK